MNHLRNRSDEEVIETKIDSYHSLSKSYHPLSFFISVITVLSLASEGLSLVSPTPFS